MEIIIIEGDACFEEIVQLLNKVELLLNSLLLGTWSRTKYPFGPPTVELLPKLFGFFTFFYQLMWKSNIMWSINFE